MKKLTTTLILILLAVGVAVGAYYLGQQNPNQDIPQINTTEESPTPEEELTGIIEGSLSYPSEGIPEDISVCAETLDGTRVSCTDDRIEDQKYIYRIGYMLEVPEGQYYVYSTRPDSVYKAYYNEFVECGLSVECESHEPIVVEVSPGETTSGIDPIDWYNRNPEE